LTLVLNPELNLDLNLGSVQTGSGSNQGSEPNHGTTIDIVLSPLKKAAQIGVIMLDPLAYHCFCFSPLAVYIVDTPESALIAGVGGKTSLVTMAFYK
jgi:hypothetical protein